VSAAPTASLFDAWTAMVANARRSLAAVERGPLRTSARQQQTWRQITATEELLASPATGRNGRSR
jgi:hypothetical protein